MNSFTQPSRLVAAAGAVLALTACGGGNDADLFLAGEIYGLTKPGLVLENKGNGSTLSVPAFAERFVFEQRVANDESFDVQVKTQPTGAVCSTRFNSGRTGAYSINSIQVHCITNSYQLGGTISGLTGSGLVIINGADKLTVPAGATSFVMPTKVADGASYGLIIFNQPDGQQCTMTGASTARMGSGDTLDAVQIAC